MAGFSISNMQELAINDTAYALYQAMSLPTRAGLRELLPGDHVFDIWRARALAVNYFRVNTGQVNAQLAHELSIWNVMPDKSRRYDTGYNGPGGVNEVVSQETCDELVAGWSTLANSVLGAVNARNAWSATNGARTGKRMHDFLIEVNNKPVFNFHIEVERGDPT